MIELKPVGEETYDSFLDDMIRLYAAESIAAGRWEEEEALELSRKESEALLPEKFRTENNYLFNIIADSQIVGYLWAGCNDPKRKEAFLFALEVFEEYRRKGYGKKALAILEVEIKRRGFTSIRLHVFEQSTAALGLYNSQGYRQVSRIMKKDLTLK